MNSVLVIVGSTRPGSLNRALARAVVARFDRLRAVGVEVDLRELPFYTPGLDQDPRPVAVELLLEEIRAADAVLWATPEYNAALPALMKNVTEWVQRAGDESGMTAKPTAAISASSSRFGGTRAREMMQQALMRMGGGVIGTPVIAIGNAHTAMAADGTMRLPRSLETAAEELEELLLAGIRERDAVGG